MRFGVKKILNSSPINKTAALITNQRGCVDGIDNTAKQELKALGQQKAHYGRMIVDLKHEMKINRPLRTGKVPMHILRHPKYPILRGLMDKMIELDLLILKQRTVIERTK